MRTGALLATILALVGCDKKKPAGGAEAPAGSATGSAATKVVAEPPPPAPPEPKPAPPPPAPATDQPPLSADVLPRDEATPKTRAVIADDYRFQVPDTFTRADENGHAVYTGSVEGFAKPATLTFWASSEPFKGNLDALVARETKAAADGKAPAPDVGPVMVFVADKVKQGYAKRMTIKFPDRIELRTVVAHNGKAFIHHCATQNVANAWANVGSDCITRSTTFHVAPPPLKAVAKPSGPPPPDTPNVLFMASKLEGKARPKADVNPWLEDDLAPFIKPCLAKLTSGTSWHVTFEIAKDGTLGRATVGDGDALVASSGVVECVGKALAGHKLDGRASDVVKVTGIFTIK